MGPQWLSPTLSEPLFWMERNRKETIGKVPVNLVYDLRALLTTDKPISPKSPLQVPNPATLHIICGPYQGAQTYEQ